MTFIQETMDFYPKSKHSSSKEPSPSRRFGSPAGGKPPAAPRKDSGNIGISAFCSQLEKQGIHIGRNGMFVWLRKSGYLSKQKNTWNMPHQKYVAQGLFAMKETFVLIADEQVPRYSPLITPKGRDRLTEKLLEEAAADKKLKSAK